jgi:RHS repeat-associated protein
VQEYSYDAYGRRRDKDDWSYTLTGEPALFADRGYTGHEHLDPFGLINMNGRLYDPLVGRFLSPDNYVQAPDYTQSFNRYGYCWNNPLRYTDPSGDFLTWSINNGGLSFGVNFTPSSVPLGFGINIGWGNGFSFGLYGEVGYRVGGSGIGSGATISQSIDFNFKNSNWSTTTSEGAYASFGPFNAGVNFSQSYNITNKQWSNSWGVSAGVGIGNEGSGVGIFVGYGSGGWSFGIGGFYDNKAWDETIVYNLPETKSSPEGNLPIHMQDDPTVGCTQEVMESLVEYRFGTELRLDKSAGADFRLLGGELGYDVKRNYNDVHRVGKEMLKGNPSAITYDNGGTMHTVGINKISVFQRVKLFGGGYRYKSNIQVMNPLYKTYRSLPYSSFRNGVVRTIYF